MNLARVMREVAQELRGFDDDPPSSAWVQDLGAQLEDALAEPERAVDLAICVGSECIRLHGVRVATWTGRGPCSIYCAICDECHAERLTAEEREHMVELFGASWIRHMGLHELHQGHFPEKPQ